MTKSKAARRRKEPAATPGAPVRSRADAARGHAPGAAKQVRPSAGPAAMGLVAVLAALGVAVLVVLEGGIPAATARPSAAASGTGVVTGTVAAGPEVPRATSADPTVQAEVLSGLATCGGYPCPERGSADAKVTLIEISDFRCSHCQEYNLNSEPVIYAKYVEPGLMRYVAHVFGFNDDSRAIAAAALCANDQGKFFEFKRVAFEAAGPDVPDATDFRQWGGEIGLDMSAFGTCLDQGRHLDEVQRSTTQALDAGIQGTPSFVLNGHLTEGDPILSEYLTLIDAMLASTGATP